MSKVLLGDVAKERRETCKSSKDGYPIVGLEHLTPEEITLTAWDEGKENTFSKLFREGDILFGRRRAYLKKAAVAPFDGICSGDITVIEAMPESLLPELLPFIIQNDALFDFAVGKSAGSLSPRVKWENLMNYEFELPEMDKQRELAKILWAIDTTKKTYQKLLQKTDELVKSQFVEMLGDPVTNPMGWEKKTLQALIDNGCVIYHLDGNHGELYPRSDEFINEGVPYIGANCISDGRIEYHNAKYLTEERADGFRKGVAISGDVLFAHNATVGPVAILETILPKVILSTSLTAYRCDLALLNPYYLKAYMESPAFITQYEAEMGQTTRNQVPITKQRSFQFLVPPLGLQNRFADFVRQADKSKFELEEALAKLDATCKRIISENLG
ncbi:restriction endonuclease subunit S [Paenibacillus sp. MBLB4367]|uniref:restriction endonuclease subunit S n=1 Tax=Paenibacillus sp. MBLB4367 TaxID=3384767 RepID=UPI00390828C7